MTTTQHKELKTEYESFIPARIVWMMIDDEKIYINKNGCAQIEHIHFLLI